MVGFIFWLCVGSIVYTYAGYPALVTFLARFRKQSSYAPATPSVTLLIAAHNEQTVIAEKLENSLALDYPRDRLQILVAADGSDDATPSIVESFADRGVELSYSPPRRGKMAAINRAVERAHGDILIMSDANNMYGPEVLRELVAPFADPDVGMVTGSKHIASGDGALGESEGLYWRYESFVKEQETRLGCCTGVCGEVLALRRNLFEVLPSNIINEDTFMALRVIKRGYRVVYAPNARSYERVSVSAQDEVARRARIFAGRYQTLALAHTIVTPSRPLVLWQVASHQFMRTLVSLAMVGALFANLVAVVRPSRSARRVGTLGAPLNWIMLLVQVLFYGVAFVGNRVESKGKLGKVLYIPTFLVNSNLAGVIGLFRFLTGRQTTLWQRAKRRENAQLEHEVHPVDVTGQVGK